MSEPSSSKALAPPKSQKQKPYQSYEESKKEKILYFENHDKELRALDLTKWIRKLPFELRDEIFRPIMYDGYELNDGPGKTPELVVALRGTEFYDQVLKMWYQGTYLKLRGQGGPSSFSVEGMKPSALLMLEKLSVYCRYKEHDGTQRLEGSARFSPNLYSEDKKYSKVRGAENIQKLCLNVHKLPLENERFKDLVEMWLAHLNIKKLFLVGVEWSFAGSTMAAMNSKLQNVQSCSLEQVWTFSAAYWEAEDGKFLTWKKDPPMISEADSSC